MKKTFNSQVKINKTKKKTRQGMGRHTKFSNKLSPNYKKKSRGQG